MNEPEYYAGVARVQIIEDPSAVTDALANGWQILRIPDQSNVVMEPSGKTYITTRPVFVLGLHAAEDPGAVDEGVEARLEALRWVQARSGRCDFAKDAPEDLIAAVDARTGFKGSAHHFTRAKDGSTLFRFERAQK